jgi:hypothetical protein
LGEIQKVVQKTRRARKRFADAFRLVAEADLEALRKNPRWRSQVQMIIRFCDRSDVRDVCAKRYREVDEAFGELYADLLHHEGAIADQEEARLGR